MKPKQPDKEVLRLLREAPIHTVESLVGALEPWGFAAVFGAVDRLARSGHIRITRAGRHYVLQPCEPKVAAN